MPAPISLPILSFENEITFENWLSENHLDSTGIWLKIFKKGSKQQTVTYAEALDVALCYGWIDGQKKSFDEHAWLQKFCPLGKKSTWSKINIGHVERLIKAGRMHVQGHKMIEHTKETGSWDQAYDSPSNMTIPDDFLQALSNNQQAEAFFKQLNKTNLYAIGFRLQTAKRAETLKKRMRETIEMLENGGKFH